MCLFRFVRTGGDKMPIPISETLKKIQNNVLNIEFEINSSNLNEHHN